MKSRLIRPAMFVDEQLAKVGYRERFFVIGMLGLADREGRMEDRPLKIRAQVLPYETVNGEEILAELSNNGIITRTGGYIQINCFNEWVSPFRTEKESVIPEMLDCSTVVEQCSYPVATPSYTVATVKGIGKRISKRKSKKEQMEPFPPELVSMVLCLLQRWPTTRKGEKFKNDPVSACSNIERALDSHEGLTLDMLRVAALEYLDNLPDFPNAIENWFGPGKPGTIPPWKIAVRGVLTNEVAV